MISAKSKSDTGTVEDKNKFLEDVISELKLTAPLIISPSLSGSYSLHYLFSQPDKVLKRAAGYVPVAPVSTEKYTAEQYKQLKVWILVKYCLCLLF